MVYSKRLLSKVTQRQRNQAGVIVPPATQTADFSKLYTMLSKGDIKIAAKFWVDRILNSNPVGDWGIQLTLNGETLV
jgi:hypothetical protein